MNLFIKSVRSLVALRYPHSLLKEDYSVACRIHVRTLNSAFGKIVAKFVQNLKFCNMKNPTERQGLFKTWGLLQWVQASTGAVRVLNTPYKPRALGRVRDMDESKWGLPDLT